MTFSMGIKNIIISRYQNSRYIVRVDELLSDNSRWLLEYLHGCVCRRCHFSWRWTGQYRTI